MDFSTQTQEGQPPLPNEEVRFQLLGQRRGSSVTPDYADRATRPVSPKRCCSRDKGDRL